MMLAFAVVHCDREENNVPIATRFGTSGGSSSGGVKFDAAGGGGSSGTNEPGPGDDPGFDPLADGGIWSGYDAGEEGNTLPDGGKNGGPNVYQDYGSCPEVKVEAFVTDNSGGDTATYGAPYTPGVPGTFGRINLLIATDTRISYLGPFFPLGFIDPPGLVPPASNLKVETFPFFGKCKRCLWVPTGEGEDTAFVAIGGMLVIGPSPSPTSGKINARVDLVVLLESKKGFGDFFWPIDNPRCMRVRSAPIVVR